MALEKGRRGLLLVSHLASFVMIWSLASASVAGGGGAPFTACAAIKAFGFCDGKMDSMNCSICSPDQQKESGCRYFVGN